MENDIFSTAFDDLSFYDEEAYAAIQNEQQDNLVRVVGDLNELGPTDEFRLLFDENNSESVERTGLIDIDAVIDLYDQEEVNLEHEEQEMIVEEQAMEEAIPEGNVDRFIHQLQTSCNCIRNCWQNHHGDLQPFFAEMCGMKKPERKQMAYTILSLHHESNNIRNRVKYFLPFINSQVCRSFFLSFFILGPFQLRSLLKMLSNKRSLLICPHGNVRNDYASLPLSTKIKAKEFLQNLAKERAEPIGVRRFIRHKENGETHTTVQSEKFLLLPSHFSQDGLHILYNKSFPNDIIKSRMTFVNLWQNDEELKWIKIRSPSSDVCDDCHIMKLKRNDLKDATDEELDRACLNHINSYKECREAYESSILRATQDINFTSIAFDYQQNQECPKIPQQPGCWYYWCPLKIYTFGLVDAKPRPQLCQGPLFEDQEGKREFLVFVLLFFYGIR